MRVRYIELISQSFFQELLEMLELLSISIYNTRSREIYVLLSFLFNYSRDTNIKHRIATKIDLHINPMNGYSNKNQRKRNKKEENQYLFSNNFLPLTSF